MKIMKQNLNSEYWEKRYLNQDTGWDTGNITTPIKEYIDQIDDKNLKILIPGCGNSYEFEYLLEKGFKNVTVLDYAQKPIDNIKRRIPNCNDSLLICGDFFDHDKHYDLIIEQTFFCALQPDLREKYATKMHELLKKNGKIVGVLFQFPLTETGPPFGGSKNEYLELFSIHFKINTLETCYNSIKPRKENELFFIFTKKTTQ